MLGKHFKDFVGDDPMPEIVGMYGIVMDHPRRLVIGVVDVAIQAVVRCSDLLSCEVEDLEDFVAAVCLGFIGAITGKCGHVIRPQ